MSVSVRLGAGRKRLMLKQIQGLALGTLLVLPLTAPALTTPRGPVPATVDVFAPFSVISRDEMAQLRGGFNIAGLELQFGANVRTRIDDIVLETNFQFTKAGIVSSTMQLAQAAANAQTARGAQLSRIAQDTASLVQAIAKRAVSGSQRPAGKSNSTAIANAGNAQAVARSGGQGPISLDLAAKLSGLRNLANGAQGQVTAVESGANGAPTRIAQSGAATGPSIRDLGGAGAQVDLSGLGNQIQGVVLKDSKGLTAAIHDITRNRIMSTVISTANYRNIDVQVNVEIDVNNWSNLSETIRNHLFNQRLATQNQIL